jgi:hypothetical protein
MKSGPACDTRLPMRYGHHGRRTRARATSVNLASTDAPNGAPRHAHVNVSSTGAEKPSASRTQVRESWVALE